MSYKKMRIRLVISALFLIGATMSVAAYSPSPVTVVDDISVTKVVKPADLLPTMIINAQTDFESVYINESSSSKVEVSATFSEKPVTISESVAIEPDHPVTERSKYSTNNIWKPDKIYLLNCCIRQC